MHLQDLIQDKEEQEKNEILRILHKRTGLSRTGVSKIATERSKVRLDSAVLICVATEGKCTMEALTHGEWPLSYKQAQSIVALRKEPQEDSKGLFD